MTQKKNDCKLFFNTTKEARENLEKIQKAYSKRLGMSLTLSQTLEFLLKSEAMNVEHEDQ